MTAPTAGVVPFLAADNISVHFNGKPAVQDISLEVGRGEVVAIIGPSGSGKSTFLRCINHLQAPTSGTVRIDGFSVTEGKAKHPSPKVLAQLRKRVGMVFQQFNLFPNLTALENVMLAQIHALGRSKGEAEAKALELLKRVGLEERAYHRPDECSGGQQQRIAIARTLALDPLVVLFDEPTSALDPELGAEVLAVMRELAEAGMTMIVVTHEMQFAADVADRLVFIAEGRIVEQGDPKEILRAPQHPRTQKFLQAVLER